jgi:maltooligosyltrehalose trehalohydrolase
VTTIVDAPLGVTVLPQGGGTALVWAPHAQTVELVIGLGQTPRRVALEALPGGYFGARFEAAASTLAAGTRYAFSLDGRAPLPDPVSRSQPDGVHAFSEAVCLHQSWAHERYRPPPLRDWVIYELHVGTFTDRGDFDSVIAELPRLKALGVTALELMPVAQFPGRRNWGYDGVYPFAAQSSYGGPHALMRLVDACHAHSLAVILDVVYNHLGPEGNYLAKYAPYFTDRYHTPWGRALNFDGPGSDEVRRYFIENAIQWIQDFRFDGLRLDAVHTIHDGSAFPFLEELAARTRTLEARLERPVVLIAESDTNDPRLVCGREHGGFGLDGMWCDDFHHAAHVLLTGEQNGYYADYAGVAPLGRAWQSGMAYQGEASRYREHRQGRPSGRLEPAQVIVYLQNHDQVGNRAQGERLSVLCSFEQEKLAAALVCLCPEVPLLFMGQEFGARTPFQYFVDHGDAELLALVSDGRRRDMERFAWPDPAAPPESEATFRASQLGGFARANVAIAGASVLVRWYSTLLALRRRYPPSALSDRVVTHEAQRALTVLRGDHLCLLFAFDGQPQRLAVSLPEGHWVRLLDTADAAWKPELVRAGNAPRDPGGSQPVQQILGCDGLSLTLQPHSFVCYARSSDGDLAR